MQLSHSRLLALTAISALFALVAALPAFAGSTKTHATTVKVTITQAKEFAFTLKPKSVKHGAVTFKITNGGILTHDFEVCASNKGGTADKCKGKTSAMISPGQTGTLKVNLSKAGKYEYLCTVPGHAAAGMKGILKVT
jgi:uncharacterized cupredoxin-like copper-binding protein